MSIPQKYYNKIKSKIAYCSGCQPIDNEEEEGFYWILGDRISFIDLLEELGVPEKYYKETDEMFNCPNCGSTIPIYADVGIKSAYEIDHDKKYHHISRKIEPSIIDFALYLERFPYLGSLHPVGKRINKEIAGFPRISIQNKVWYRARRVSEDRIYTNEDMKPPNPKKVAIGEGRFNHFGQSSLYLGNSEELCHREICREINSLSWMQKILITNAENIIDLSGFIDDDAIDTIPIVFCGIMHSGMISKKVIKDKHWKPEYFVSRYIADICKKTGINGIIYGGQKFLAQ